MKTKLQSNRGGALITALIFTLMLAAVVGSYMALINFNLRASHHNYNSSRAIDLADAGIDEAMWALNRVATGGMAAAVAYPSTRGWTVAGNVAKASFTFGDSSFGTNQVNVQVTNCDLADRTTRPRVKVQSLLSATGVPITEKWVEIALDARPSIGPAKTTAPFKGIVAKNLITFNGNNPKVDSYDSGKGSYGGTNKNDHGFVGSTAVTVNDVMVRQADILGYVATYNDTDLSDNVGHNGSILGYDSPAGLQIDPNRVSTDFTASLPDVSAPTSYTDSTTHTTVPITYKLLPAITTSTKLPQPGDIPQNGYYYYSCPSISLSSDGITVNKDNITNPAITSANVVINVTGTAGIQTSGKGFIQVSTNPSSPSAPVPPNTLNIYVSSDVNITGQGILNGTPTTDSKGNSIETNSTAQAPANCTIWGTSPSSQTIKIAGLGTISTVVYAPNGDITINGNGDAMGAIVGNSVAISGNGVFHYDEALGKNSFTDPTVSSLSELVIYRWRELLDGSERHF